MSFHGRLTTSRRSFLSVSEIEDLRFQIEDWDCRPVCDSPQFTQSIHNHQSAIFNLFFLITFPFSSLNNFSFPTTSSGCAGVFSRLKRSPVSVRAYTSCPSVRSWTLPPPPVA